MNVILGSSSPARLALLTAAGVPCQVIASHVDESVITAPTVPELVVALATAKGEAVARTLEDDLPQLLKEPTLLIAADSTLELHGKAYGKPHSSQAVVERWPLMRGQWGTLYTGHWLRLWRDSEVLTATAVAGTRVKFGEVRDDDILAYSLTDEPANVAGAFTLDGLGGPFIDAIEGDAHNVIGLSLPTLRRMVNAWNIPWHTLWG